MASQPKLYNPRHPERTLLYQTVSEHCKTWLDLASATELATQSGDGDGEASATGALARLANACRAHVCTCSNQCRRGCNRSGYALYLRDLA